jgi:hypothetical protein
MPDTADKAETHTIEHSPICLFQKKMGIANPAQALIEPSAAQTEGSSAGPA